MNKFAQPTKHIVTLPDPAGSHQMVYYEWGRHDNPRVLVCVHGLTRNGRDFDFLAAALQQEYRILAPDLIGRGKSDWFKDPMHYTIEQYVHDLMGWMHQLGLSKVDYLGASLGGVLGMLIAVQPGSPVQRLILADIGPLIKRESVEKLSTEVQANPTFPSLGDLKEFLKQIYSHIGAMEPYHWDHILAYDHIKRDDGTYARAYDPNLFKSFGPMRGQDIAFWPIFQALQIPILALHGVDSIVLTPDICDEMKKLQPKQLDIIDIPNAGHVPSLMIESNIALVKQWLEQFASVEAKTP